MEVVDIEGKEYVKSRDAAKKSGYTTDYIGQLCRGKEIDSRLVGRSWYVNLADLMDYKKEKKRSSRVKAREQVKKTIQETHAAEKHTQKKNESKITYTTDEGDLIPNITKQWPTAMEESEEEESVVVAPVPELVPPEVVVTESGKDSFPTQDMEEVIIPIQKGGETTKYAHKTQIASVPQYDLNPPSATYETEALQKEGHAYINIDTDSTRLERGGTGQYLQLVFVLILFFTLVSSLVIETHWIFIKDRQIIETSYNIGVSSLRDIAQNIDISFKND